ncbi:MAG: pyridoxal phosphate-dependent aminotransferase [Pseudomonadales bacterium]
MVKIAQRLSGIDPFRVVEVLKRARELQTQGRDILHMEAGEPDFATAQPIVEAGRRALAAGATHYSEAAGIPELRQAIAAFYQQHRGLDISAERILVTPGASGALLLVAALLIDPGDTMLLADPGYPCNRNFLRLFNGDAQLVPVGPEQRYQLTAAVAEQNWSANTVGALVGSPANPTGEILNFEELSELKQLIDQRGGALIVDEIYHGLTYGIEAPSILQISNDAFVINSFSKFFGMTGWRLGWLVAPENVVPELEKLAQNLFISMSTMGQHAALAAFEPQTLEILEQRRDIFAERRNFLLPELRRLGFVIPNTPAGAFYLYADASRFTNDSRQFCLDLLEQHGVALTPGADFGSYRANEHIRFSFTTGMSQLEQAVERLEKVLAAAS